MSEQQVTLDLGVADVHTSSAAVEDERAASITAAKRKSLPEGDFALPKLRKYPLDSAARTRNAAARLEQMKKRGKVSDADYKSARARIARAAKKFGIDSEYNASDEAAVARAGKLPAGRSRRAIHVRADLAPGGALHVRHMTTSGDGAQAVVHLSDGTFGLRDVRQIKQGDEVDPASVGVTLMGPSAWKDGSPKKLVWVQIAECGAWKGHPAGPFEMSPATFSEIVRNFERRGLPVPFDFEHASEQDPTSGSIPQGGAPAPGWVHRLDNRGVGGLWGLVEWFDTARDLIKSGEYGFLSPAIRFGCRDPQTGAAIGARLTSVALTNQPFLTRLEGLRAAKDGAAAARATLCAGACFDDDAVTSKDAGLLDRKVHSVHDVMPRIKSALKMHPLDRPEAVSAKLDDLREACMSAGPDAMYAGENLHEYMQPLTALVNPSLGASWADVLDTLDEFVDAEIEKHVFEGVPMPDPPSASLDDDEPEDMTMSDKTIALKDHEERVSALEAKLSAKDGELAALSDKVTARDTLLASKEVEVKDLSDKLASRDAVITAKDAEIKDLSDRMAARDAVITAKDAEIKTLGEKVVELSAKVKATADANDERIITEAFETYKDVKKMDRASFAAIFRSDRALFDKEFPAVDPDKRHLLRVITPPAPRAEIGDDPSLAPSHGELTQRLLSEAKAAGKPISYAAASARASEMLSTSTKRSKR